MFVKKAHESGTRLLIASVRLVPTAGIVERLGLPQVRYELTAPKCCVLWNGSFLEVNSRYAHASDDCLLPSFNAALPASLSQQQARIGQNTLRSG